MLIKTKRLVIRNFKKSDYRDLHEYLSDRETYKYEPGKPETLETAKKLCEERAKENKFFAVQLNDKVIGHIYRDQTEPKKLLTWELGFIFNRKYQGKGYATEALSAIIEDGFNTTKVHRFVAHCNPKNTSSWKLLERVKMKREGRLRKNIYFDVDAEGNPLWLDTYEYGLLREAGR